LKYVNPGVIPLVDSVNNFKALTNEKFSNTGLAFINSNDTITDFASNFPNSYGNEGYWNKNFEGTTEVWASFDCCFYKYGIASYGRWNIEFLGSDTLPVVGANDVGTTSPLLKVYTDNKFGTLLYDPKKNVVLVDKAIHNIELHMKTGENGRIDVWIDTKLLFSYRSPTAFKGTITGLKISHTGSYPAAVAYSSIIIQDTRRIGLEKFKKLTIDPATEQNMAQGSTTSFTLSGLTDAAEFSDITGVVALLQPTSRDANITTGTFALNGAEVGTVDVSSSSGKDYVEAVSTVNSLTTKPWTRDDIEGKTLTLKVDGAV
jgi:hypothetical protein